MKKIFIVLTLIISNLAIAVEKRAIVTSLDKAKAVLIEQGATFKGEYAFYDSIYFPSTPSSTVSYGRVRHYEKSSWIHKPVVVTVKSPNQDVISKKGFNALPDATASINKNFRFAFKFYRQGWQYKLDDSNIFIEDVVGLPPTVEIVAKQQSSICKIFKMIGTQKVIDKSVPLFYKEINEL